MYKRRAPGYTIVETLIFLAISGVMLLAALLLFQGQQAKVQFDQSMRDLNSKISQYVDDVNSGFFPGSDKFNCSVPGTRPVLNNPGSSGAGGLGTNTQCIFLGKAIAVTPNSGNLQIFTVLGDRTIPAGQADAGDAVSSFSQAFPTPASSPVPQPCCDLTDTYTLLGGATVSTSQIYTAGNPTAINSNLVGFYIDLATSASGSAKYLLGLGYGLTGTPDYTSVDNNIEAKAGTNSYPLQRWELCLHSNNSTKTALLQINTSALGVQNKLIYGGCS